MIKWFRSADEFVRSGHKLGFSVGSAPTLSLSQREVLLLHHEKRLKCFCGRIGFVLSAPRIDIGYDVQDV